MSCRHEARVVEDFRPLTEPSELPDLLDSLLDSLQPHSCSTVLFKRRLAAGASWSWPHNHPDLVNPVCQVGRPPSSPSVKPASGAAQLYVGFTVCAGC